jgi:hypothetical protein
MYKYLKNHEKYIIEMLKQDDTDFANLKTLHEKQILYMQHERLIHLMVTLSFGIFLLLTLGYATLTNSLIALALSLMCLVMEAAYIIHFFLLENGVQRWYKLSNQIDQKLGIVSENYENLPSKK